MDLSLLEDKLDQLDAAECLSHREGDTLMVRYYREQKRACLEAMRTALEAEMETGGSGH